MMISSRERLERGLDFARGGAGLFTVAKESKKAMLSMTQLREEARKGDILPALTDNTLVSVSSMANDDYDTILWEGINRVEI